MRAAGSEGTQQQLSPSLSLAGDLQRPPGGAGAGAGGAGPLPGRARRQPLARLGLRTARAGPLLLPAPGHLLLDVETSQGQALEQFFLRPRQKER